MLSGACKNSRNAGFKKCELLIVVKVIVAPLLQGRLKGGGGGGSNRVLVQRVPHPDGRREKRIFVGVCTPMWNMQFVLMPSGTAGHFLDSTCLFRYVHVVIDDFIGGVLLPRQRRLFCNCGSRLFDVLRVAGSSPVCQSYFAGGGPKPTRRIQGWDELSFYNSVSGFYWNTPLGYYG